MHSLRIWLTEWRTNKFIEKLRFKKKFLKVKKLSDVEFFFSVELPRFSSTPAWRASQVRKEHGALVWGKIDLSWKKFQICDCFRFKQMPWKDQITKTTCETFPELPSNNISTIGIICINNVLWFRLELIGSGLMRIRTLQHNKDVKMWKH